MDRTRARALAKQFVSDNRPTEWFEVLYAEAEQGVSVVPWADLCPNPNLMAWLDRNPTACGRKALKVGCGYGDDVEELVRRGYEVTGFDVAPTAISHCRKRFPNSKARYVVADILTSPVEWNQAFDFVLESYTLQVLPPDQRALAIAEIAKLVAPQGTLLVIARGRDLSDDPGLMPWPLTIDDVRQFDATGLRLINLEDFLDQETPPVRRFRVEFRRD